MQQLDKTFLEIIDGLTPEAKESLGRMIEESDAYVEKNTIYLTASQTMIDDFNKLCQQYLDEHHK